MSDKESDAEASGAKRPHDDENNKSESEDEEWIGPLPTEAAPAKKRKGTIAVNGNPTDSFKRISLFDSNSSGA